MNEEALAEILEKPQVKRGLFIVRMAEIDPEDDFHQNLLPEYFFRITGQIDI